jgi:tRNA threonylcarbamoyladenosine biosynthesis protein TsaB
MKILAVETSGKTFSVALNSDGKTTAEFFYDCGHIHSEMLVAAVERILKDTATAYRDVDKFAVCAGPGSFTGIRVGMTAVKTFAQSLNKPVVAADALTILEKSLEIKNIEAVAAIDALRNEVYVKSGKKVVIKEIDSFVNGLKKYKNKILVAGNAAYVYKEKLSKSLGKHSVSLPESFHMPRASVLALLARSEQGISFDKIEPLYIRRSWAEESKK